MIRNDFVSNSSSTSFCIIGNYFNEDELRKYLDIDDETDLLDYIDSYLEKNGINLNYRIGISDNDLWYFGLTYDNMLENETKDEFEMRIKSLIDELVHGHTQPIECYTDGGYDG